MGRRADLRGQGHSAGPALGDPSGRAYRKAAIAAIRATATSLATPLPTSPAGWSEALDGLPNGGLRADVDVDLDLNGALNDTAVAVYGAKRTYQAPRPISMIRYLAFNRRLPLVPGLVRRAANGTIEVRLRGRWVRGDRWQPPWPTPASPGYPSADAAFAYAARQVLGSAVDSLAGRAAQLGVAQGTELPADAAAGQSIGIAVGKRALTR